MTSLFHTTTIRQKCVFRVFLLVYMCTSKDEPINFLVTRHFSVYNCSKLTKTLDFCIKQYFKSVCKQGRQFKDSKRVVPHKSHIGLWKVILSSRKSYCPLQSPIWIQYRFSGLWIENEARFDLQPPVRVSIGLTRGTNSRMLLVIFYKVWNICLYSHVMFWQL